MSHASEQVPFCAVFGQRPNTYSTSASTQPLTAPSSQPEVTQPIGVPHTSQTDAIEITDESNSPNSRMTYLQISLLLLPCVQQKSCY